MLREKKLVLTPVHVSMKPIHLGEKITANAKVAVVLGQDAQKNRISYTQDTGLKTHIQIVYSLADEVDLADHLAEAGDFVLLSPACASYDMFDNFQQRGQEFMRHVRALNTYRTNSQTQSA